MILMTGVLLHRLVFTVNTINFLCVLTYDVIRKTEETIRT